ncbi:aquaporin-10-like [Oppia nitens]|uniref:aquaporin-10-like n=1 Tax=Oppia nitens TaxID=1686743 RepID=UPI0023DBEE76|nr:aquaporin-10-like [Oppia nitens]XP_054164604.1 aquaporin-10-like [Oppia nitens]
MSENRVLLGGLKTKNIVIREFLSEFIGTLILVLMCNCSIAVQVLSRRPHLDLNSVGIATGVGLMIAAYLGAKVSGGHVNPVVTLAVATLGKFPYRKIPHYFIAQYLGGFVASILVYLNFYSAINEYDGGIRSAFFNSTSTAGIMTTHPTLNLTPWGALCDQIISVALLQFGIMCLIDPKNQNVPKPLIPIAFSLLLAALIMAFGHNCGPALNPARDIPGRIFAIIIGYGSDVWGPQSFVYWIIGGLIGPHIGAIIGAWIYYLLIELHLEDDQQLERKEDVLLQKISEA